MHEESKCNQLSILFLPGSKINISSGNILVVSIQQLFKKEMTGTAPLVQEHRKLVHIMSSTMSENDINTKLRWKYLRMIYHHHNFKFQFCVIFLESLNTRIGHVSVTILDELSFLNIGSMCKSHARHVKRLAKTFQGFVLFYHLYINFTTMSIEEHHHKSGTLDHPSIILFIQRVSEQRSMNSAQFSNIPASVHIQCSSIETSSDCKCSLQCVSQIAYRKVK